MRCLLRLTLCLTAVLLGVAAFAADLAPGDVIFAAPAEQYGFVSGAAAFAADGAHGGTALSLSEQAYIAGAVDVQPGQYTLLVRVFAPAGDADGFFVEIGKERTRRTAPIGHWGVLAYPVEVKEAQQLPLTVIGQEPGMLLDDIALVRGAFKDDQVDTGKLLPTGAAARVGAAGIKRLLSGCRLKDFPPKTALAGACSESFERVPATVTGEHRTGPGFKGQAVFLDQPDGRFDMDATALGAMPTGTITWWVKPRPNARIWEDYAWRYYLYGAPAQPGGVRLDLSRHPSTQLQLAVSVGDKLEKLALSTSGLDPQQWHQLLVSWDLRPAADRQYLWLMIDGVGQQLFFPKTFAAPAFSSLQFCNRPADGDTPLLPMDGGLDEITVSREPVTARLAQ